MSGVLSEAINVSVIAFSMVFGVLLVLTGTIFAMRIFGGSEKKNDLNGNAKAQGNNAPVVKSAAVKNDADKTKLIAAITAAIIEFTGNANFRILSVTQNNSQGDVWTNRWRTAGLLNLNSNTLVRKWR